MSKSLETDYCVIGLGPAGAVIANKLAAAGKRVLVLEHGPRISEKNRADALQRRKETLNDFADYNDEHGEETVTPQSSPESQPGIVPWAAKRIFAVGGSGLHFGGWSVRPTSEDFQVKSLYGYGRDWPIDYGELEPWLLRAEHELGVSGTADNPYAAFRSGPFPMPAHEFSHFDRELFGPAISRLGYTGHHAPYAVNSKPYRGRSACLACRACTFCPSGARYSPDRVHVPPIDAAPNATILDSVSLRRMELSADGKKIEAVHALGTRDKEEIVVKARQFVLALAGVENPRMLFLSAGNGDHQNGIGNSGGQLGKGFSDHLIAQFVYDTGKHVGGRLGFETMQCDHFNTAKERGKHPAFIFLGAPHLEWALPGVAVSKWAQKNGVLSLKHVREAIPRISAVWAQVELSGTGQIDLDQDQKDAFGDPVARVTMRTTDWDRAGVARAKSIGVKLGEAMKAFETYVDPAADTDVGYHPSGATAMASNPDQGVCDQNLKVFGTENLYLAGSSVFPHLGAEPPTLTIVALALRLASHLNRQK